ncbi:rCG38078 [Rattus norvegicus]|uniref:60S ribosomal protein L21 n=1 Tax=Rattus norvegicus TaxID=10116 RepID=A6IV51_RAT|nr:rCG38078 [Rattus norvegicus]
MPSTRERITGVPKLRDKNTTRTGWMRHLKIVYCRFRHGFHEGTPKPKRASCCSIQFILRISVSHKINVLVFKKRMPHTYYHGKTGRVYNVTQHAMDIIVKKQVKGKQDSGQEDQSTCGLRT